MQRFYKKVNKTDSCWLWIAERDKDGYGRFWYEGKVRPAHRISYILHTGPIEEGKFIMHTCDNPPCVNPEHLKQGTHEDNMNDKVAKNRHTWGERNPGAKLTDYQVEKVRAWYAAGLSQSELARTFNITLRQIHNIVKYKQRNLVPAPVGELEAGESDSQITASELDRISIEGTE